ncbi:MAG: amidohydrolase family protein [Deferrisomatales bacterium]
MVIDFHTHAFPADRAAAVMAAMAERARIPSYADGTEAGLRASMDAAGVDLSVVSRITTSGRQVRAVNRWLLGLQGPRLRAAATLHPEAPSLPDEIAWLHGAGFKGIKLHPDYQGFMVDDRRMFPAYEALAALGLWVLFHAGLDRGLPGPVHAPPDRLLRVHRAFPGLRMVLAHLGGEDVYEATEELLLGCDLYLDTSFVLRKIPEATLRRFARKHPAERLLFGTDSPWSHQGEDLAYLRSRSFWSAGEKERIAGGNAAELLGLGGTGEA